MVKYKISLLFKFLTFQPFSQSEERDFFLRSAYKNINEVNAEKYGLFISELAFYTGYTPREALAMYAEVQPYLKDINDIQDIVHRIEGRSNLIGLNTVFDCMIKHNLHFKEGTQEQTDAINAVLKTLPKNLQAMNYHNKKPSQVTFEA